MSCKNICKICPNLSISTSVAFAAGALTINIPAGSYANGEKVCLVVAQAIPTDATIDAPVNITIGEGTAAYPLQRRDGVQVTAREIRTRTRYATCVATNATTGAFRVIGNLCNSLRGTTIPAIDGTAPAAPGG